MKVSNVWKHFKTITYHKLLVMRHCFRIGLYKQGLTHDLSKYMPTEFLAGVTYYQGTRSPNVKEREEKGYSLAWMRHKGRNRHHYEFWTDYSEKEGHRLLPMPMPTRFLLEMFADRVAASKVYQKDAYTDSAALTYYLHEKDRMVIHPKTKKQLEFLLRMLARDGEEKTFHYIRTRIMLKKK